MMIRLAAILTTLLTPPAALADTNQCAGLSQLSGDQCGSGALQSHVNAIFDIIFIIASIVAVIVIIIGALNFVFSGGDPKKAAKARNTVLGAVIGLVLVILARAIAAYVIGAIAG